MSDEMGHRSVSDTVSTYGHLMPERVPTLTEFLLARIAEDEREANACLAQYIDGQRVSTRRWRRQLAECEAKRRIVEASRDYHESDEDPDPHDPDGGWALSIALRALALPYADHPDYRDEWRP